MDLDALIAHISRRISETIPVSEPLFVAAHALEPASLDLPMASYIDHTLLKADATPDQIDTLCQEAREHSFASVCVNPLYVARCVQLLAGSSVQVCAVVGFPLGATTTEVKVFEARQAIHNGAREIDMVQAVGHLKAGDYAAVFDDIRRVVTVCHSNNALCKVIIETALLNDEEKVAACLLAIQAGADFVKTSTGFAASGATAQDVALMRRVAGSTAGVKASGGVRTRRDAQALFAAGATRIGASASVQIVTGDQRPTMP
jgi:deoxyribose-phosphate aldolase